MHVNRRRKSGEKFIWKKLFDKAQNKGLFCSQNGLADDLDLEANLLELFGVQNQAAIENEGRLVHVSKDAVVVEGLELVPLSQHKDRVDSLCCLISRGRDSGHLLDYSHHKIIQR